MLESKKLLLIFVEVVDVSPFEVDDEVLVDEAISTK